MSHTIETLKELVAHQIDAVRGELTARDRALELQSTETHRRLDELNNEAGRILAASRLTVSSDTWEAFLHSDREWKRKVDQVLAQRSGRESGTVTSTDRLFQFVSMIASLAAIAGVALLALSMA